MSFFFLPFCPQKCEHTCGTALASLSAINWTVSTSWSTGCSWRVQVAVPHVLRRLLTPSLVSLGKSVPHSQINWSVSVWGVWKVEKTMFHSLQPMHCQNSVPYFYEHVWDHCFPPALGFMVCCFTFTVLSKMALRLVDILNFLETPEPGWLS